MFHSKNCPRTNFRKDNLRNFRLSLTCFIETETFWLLSSSLKNMPYGYSHTECGSGSRICRMALNCGGCDSHPNIVGIEFVMHGGRNQSSKSRSCGIDVAREDEKNVSNSWRSQLSESSKSSLAQLSLTNSKCSSDTHLYTSLAKEIVEEYYSCSTEHRTMIGWGITTPETPPPHIRH